jgi:hypothetical protein
MGTFIVRFFIVLCCYTTENGYYKYDVVDVKDSTANGTLISFNKYNKGDTIKFYDNYK